MTDLDELKRLLAEATPAPWEFISHQGNTIQDAYLAVTASPRGVLLDTLNAGSVRTLYAPEDQESGWVEEGESADNLRLIAAARNALPGLIAEVERLRAEVERLKERNRQLEAALAALTTPLEDVDKEFVARVEANIKRGARFVPRGGK